LNFEKMARRKSTNSPLRVGIAGIGFMGWIHYLAYRRVPGVEIVAICTRDKKKLAGDWRGIRGNFGPPGEKVDVSGIKRYADLRELINDPEIDLIDNCLPPYLHHDVTVKALRAGKHVFLEKPMALTVADCVGMVAEAHRNEKQVLVGHVLPFFPEYAEARRIIDSGKYGRVLGGHFLRVISDPLWIKDFFDPHRVGGPLVDLHVHDAHFIRLLFGMPVTITSRGRMRGSVVEYCNSQFTFEDAAVVVSATSGVINQQGRGFTHGFEIHLEKATMQFEFAAFADQAEFMPFKLIDHKGKVLRPKLGGGDPIQAFEAEIVEVANSIRSRRASPILSGAFAHDAIAICHKQTESVMKGRTVRV
jgi:predicted dehydrogenase